ncbi:TVP38/TMEM64 family protein [Microvirga sp. 2MCAF38]|uniref:TVP38/TMEM64 family protein n=1 Tax=Microvirga sp. 2MCAF38 TaxID=3232989 RepID=UPI003F983AAE
MSFDALLDRREEMGLFVESRPWTALALFTVVYIGAVVLSMPAAAFLCTAGGFLFGWQLGALAGTVSATLGGVCVFLIVRTSLGNLFKRGAGPRLQALAAGFRQNAFSYVLFFRLLPIVPSWLVSMAAASVGVRLRIFASASLIGIIPISLAFAIAGAGLDDVLREQQKLRQACLVTGGTDCRVNLSITNLLTPEIITALAFLGFLVLLSILLKHFHGAKTREGSLS